MCVSGTPEDITKSRRCQYGQTNKNFTMTPSRRPALQRDFLLSPEYRGAYYEATPDSDRVG